MALARTQQTELLDRLADQAPANDLIGNLRDIRRANRWFGGTKAVIDAVGPLLPADPDLETTILDVATGSADIPFALDDWAEREGINLRIVATDIQPAILSVAESLAGSSRVRVELADALNLPYADDAFDIVTLSLALHHFDPRDAVRVLHEMRRVGRVAMIVNDLERSRIGFVGGWLFGHLLTTNPMTRHDAPLSVRRAYTRQESLALAHAAGWHAAKTRGVFPARYLLTGRPP